MQKKKKVSKNKIIKKKPTPTIKLKTKISDDLEYMARTMLGEPVISVELTKDQMNVLYINADNSFSLYSTLSHLSIEELKELKEYWITKYFFALCQETLGMIRGKFSGSLPIPGKETTLNYSEILNDARMQKDELRSMILKLN